MNVYLELTKQFNAGRSRAIITSGQAVVLHRLAIMSKDGDWILREDQECLDHILKILSGHKAKYRFGAPLSLAWLQHGWSSHFEFFLDKKRIRADFFTRPPRILFSKVCSFWDCMNDPPFVSEVDLAETKKTMRMKDYAVIGELARIMKTPQNMILYSRSARDLLQLRNQHTDLFSSLVIQRPVLRSVDLSLDDFERALFDEQLSLMRLDEARLAKYSAATENFRLFWPDIEQKMINLPLEAAHDIMGNEAEKHLPKKVSDV